MNEEHKRAAKIVSAHYKRAGTTEPNEPNVDYLIAESIQEAFVLFFKVATSFDETAFRSACRYFTSDVAS